MAMQMANNNAYGAGGAPYVAYAPAGQPVAFAQGQQPVMTQQPAMAYAGQPPVVNGVPIVAATPI